MLEELEIVVLTDDLPEHGLKAGDVGTIVLVHGEAEGYEVEFTSLTGETLAIVSVYPNQIRRVGHREIAHVRVLDA
ncbi:MAG: DUF4926 domain-containing protein [Anaerolineae bacterium]|nr:DUF4926 domain-containing protein [Anaerolineae bacterium]